MADGVMLFDADANVLFINDVARNMLGLSTSESRVPSMERYRFFDLEGNLIPFEELS